VLDLIMVATLAVCCGLVYLLVHWCHKQVDSNEWPRPMYERRKYCDHTWRNRIASGRLPCLCAGSPGKIL